MRADRDASATSGTGHYGAVPRRPLRAIAFTLVLGAAATFVVVAAPPAGAVPPVDRIGGGDRYATAVAISQSQFGAGVPVVYVATGASFPDGLAGGPAAAVGGGPVLLTMRDSIPASTASELERLHPGRIVVLGGPASISDSVVSALQAYTAGSVTRIAGTSRYETAAQVSAAVFAPKPAVAYVANGESFPDALAGGPAAGREHGPLLLVQPNSVPDATAAELQRLQPARVVILGGVAAVGAGVESQLHAYAPDVSRVQGGSRFDTAVAVANTFPTGVPLVYLATAWNFPDALTAGAPGGRLPAPILLVASNCIPPAVNAAIDRLAPGRIAILGGAGAVGPDVERRSPCPAGQPARTPSVSPAAAPAWNDDGPDPQVVRFGSGYYAYTTGTTWGNRIGVLVSNAPNGGWSTYTGQPFGSTALPSVPAWEVPDTQTSPGVFFFAGRYVMFYDAIVQGAGRYCITVATSSSPLGPFTDNSSGPMICQLDLGGSIDPQPFIDADGRPWLHWKNNDGSSPAVSEVWGAPLGADGTTLAAPAQSVMAKDSENHPWQTTVDDPAMVLADGVYYLFFSGGDWQSADYAVGYAVCAGPAGPCSQPRVDPILGSYGSVAGPGGGMVVQDTNGQWWLVYQGWTSGCTNYACGGKRKLYVAPLSFF
jgi:putative cell wall-binding protein